jgi:hypothetical protein
VHVRLAIFVIVVGFFARVAAAQSILNVESMSGEPIALSADEVSCSHDECVFLGNVMLTSGNRLMSARTLDIDLEDTPEGKRRIKKAVASGDVLLIDGNTMTTCERIELNGDLVSGTLALAEIRVKKPGSFDPKLQGFDRLGAGTDQLYMTGVITRTGRQSFVVKDAYFTPCDCGKDTRPLFSVRAKEAHVELGSHAVFLRPVLQPGDFPLPFPFALPALYIPVSKRKMGILPPAIRLLGVDGFYAEESFFLPLGPSFDMTATAGVNVARGFRDMLELRYAPDVGVEGSFYATHMLDYKFSTKERPTSELGPNRVSAILNHRSGSWGRTPVRIFGQFFSDNQLLSVQQYTVAAQATQYSPSRLAADYRGDAWRLSVGAAMYQDFQAPTFFGSATACAQDPRNCQQGRVVQRIPELGFFLAPQHLGGGVTLAVDARFDAGFALRPFQTVSYEAEDPLFKTGGGVPTQQTITEALHPPGAYADCAQLPSYDYVGPDGLPPKNAAGAPIVDAQGKPLQLASACARPLRFGRFDVVPRLARPFELGFLSVRPELFGLFAIGADSIVNAPTPRGFVGLKVELSTHFGRVFQVSEETALRHRVRPIVSYLLIPSVLGTLPQYIFDERDQFRAAHQLVFGFETDLFRRTKGTAARTLTLSIVQQANLGLGGTTIRDLRSPNLTPVEQRTLAAAPGLASLVARVAFDWRPFAVSLRSSVDMQTKLPQELAARVTVYDGAGTSAYVDYARFINGGYARMNTGLFEIAPGGAVVPNARSGGLHVAGFGATVQAVRRLFLSYAFGLAFGDGINFPRVAVQGQQISARLTGACECFGVEVGANFLPTFFTATPTPPVINVSLTLGDYTFRPQ